MINTPFDYDLAIIGAGWAGFNAALRARELGLKVCLIEKSQIGGTCLNLGCIPAKALIQSAKIASLSQKLPEFGLESQGPLKLDWLKVQQRKEKIIQQLRQGMQFGLKEVDYLNNSAEFISPEELRVGDRVIKSKFILIAAGSKSIELSAFKFDGQKIISSNEALNLKSVPNAVLIIGGGVIGCEFASLFANLGAKVTIAEKLPRLLPHEDSETAKKIETIFKKKGIKVNTNVDAASLNLDEFSLIMVCVGRTPEITGLNLEKAGIKTDKGRIIVDDYLRTNLKNIYAAGDCTAKLMLAHYAAYQGEIAAENIAHPKKSKKANNPNIPNCIFTDPEIASVGLSEEKARERGDKIKIHKFDFLGSGMARIINETDGFIKIISCAKTDCLLGASIIGPRATELIGILTLAVSSCLKLRQLRETIFAHPTLSESLSEAAKSSYEIKGF